MKKNRGFTLFQLIVVVAVLIVLSLVAVVAGNFYGYIFSKEVVGVVDSVDSALPDNGMLVGNNNASTAFSAAVSLKMEGGVYQTFSTDDRQWATLRGEKGKGKCVRVKIYPYAPWELGKAGTYHGGRLLTMADTCGKLPK